MAHRKHRRAPQIATTGKLTLPSDQPDIEFLLRVTSTPAIEQCIVSTKQLRVVGYINILVEYVASVVDDTQPVTFLIFKLPIDRTFPYRHARMGLHAYLKCDVNHQQLQLTNPREIEATINIIISKAKLSRVYHPLLPHNCKPHLVNFFDSGNFNVVVTPTPEQSSTQPIPIADSQGVSLNTQLTKL